jgi:1-acyl-sn-glycerol-3-phosphate acyltransferase
MKLFLKRVHAYFYRFNVGFLYILLWPAMYYCSRKPERYLYMNKIRGFWGLTSSLFSGIIYKYEIEAPIDWTRTYIICPNHTSNLDISAVSVLAKNNYSFMGKEELLDGFVTGLYFRTVDIPVNRESKISSFKVFKKAAERLSGGQTMVIFPEGKIPPNYPPKLEEFKNGPFRLAIELKIPIIPRTSPDTWKVLWDDGIEHGSKPGVCHIFVHKPIETTHLTIDDADELRDRVHNIIQQKLAEYDHR